MKRILLALICVAALVLVAAPAAQAAISVDNITPNSALAGDTVYCTVGGDFYHPIGFLNFTPHFSLVLGAYTITGTTTDVDDLFGAWADVTFNIPSNAPSGSYDLHGSQTAGFNSYTDTLLDAFSVDRRPTITTVIPNHAAAGSGPLTVDVWGADFQAAFLFQPASYVGVNASAIPTTYISSTHLQATIPATALASPGTLTIRVVNPGGLFGTDVVSDPYYFNVTAPVPVITSLTPASASVGGPAFNLGVTGVNFVTGVNGAVVYWGATALTTTRDSATHLTAAVPAALIAAATTVNISVLNGPPGSPVSNLVPFAVSAAVPSVSSLSTTPAALWAGYVKNDAVLTVTGANFVSGARIVLSGGEKTTTTFVNATQLTVPLTAADLATAGVLTVSVKNPPFPPGTPSLGALQLTIQSETTNPTVSITGADAGDWYNAPVALTFNASDSQSGLQSVQYMAPPAVASWTSGTSYTVPTTTQGPIVVSAQALDWCNKSATASLTVNIDTTKPGTQTLGDVSVKKGKTAKLKYRVTEPSNLSPSADVVIKIKKSNGNTAKTFKIYGVSTNKNLSKSFTCNLAKGKYKWYVEATDMAGNTQENIAQARLTVK